MKFEGARARNFVGQIFFFIPNLLFIGSQEAVKKIWSKIWIFHGSKVVERGKYSLLMDFIFQVSRLKPKSMFALENVGKLQFLLSRLC
jgi:hypothetical protein